MPSLLWLQTGACSGDSMAVLNAESPSLLEALAGVELLFHPSLSLRSPHQLGELITEIEAGRRELTVLAVEGSVMLGPDGTGRYDVFLDRAKKDLILSLAAHAQAVVAVGTCAAFGGIPASGPNPTDAVGLQYLREDPEAGLFEASWRSKAGLPVVNISGCPAHPTAIAQTLRWVLTGQKVTLDHLHRPKDFFDVLVHQGCTRNEHHEFDVEDTQLGGSGCLFYNLGCQGPNTTAICNSVLWNNQSSKVRAGVPCVGCTLPNFPQPKPLFATEKVGGVPLTLPLGVNRARYLSYKGLAKDATPERLKKAKGSP